VHRALLSLCVTSNMDVTNHEHVRANQHGTSKQQSSLCLHRVQDKLMHRGQMTVNDCCIKISSGLPVTLCNITKQCKPCFHSTSNRRRKSCSRFATRCLSNPSTAITSRELQRSTRVHCLSESIRMTRGDVMKIVQV